VGKDVHINTVVRQLLPVASFPLAIVDLAIAHTNYDRKNEGSPSMLIFKLPIQKAVGLNNQFELGYNLNYCWILNKITANYVGHFEMNPDMVSDFATI